MKTKTQKYWTEIFKSQLVFLDPNLEAAQTSNSWLRGKEHVAYPFTRTLFGHKEEWITDTRYYNTDTV